MNLKTWFNDTIYVARVAGINYATGQPTYGTPFAVKCRFEYQQKTVVDVNGEERVSSNHFATDTEIKIDDRVWLPGVNQSDPSKASKILSIESASTKQKTSKLWQVYL